MTSNCKIQVLSRNFHELQNFHLHFCQPQTACVVERSLWRLPTASQPCFLHKNIHLFTLENSKGQWERNPRTGTQEAFLSGQALTVETDFSMQSTGEWLLPTLQVWKFVVGLLTTAARHRSFVCGSFHSPHFYLNPRRWTLACRLSVTRLDLTRATHTTEINLQRETCSSLGAAQDLGSIF